MYFYFFIFVSLTVNAAQPVVASYYVAAGNPVAVSRLPAEKLSHVIYAFFALCGNNSGANDTTQKAIRVACQGKEPYSAVIFNEKAVMSELVAFKQLKQQHPHLLILPSFGGWTLSQPFHGMAKSDSARQQFVQSAVALIEKHEVFDGIDIDWEYPGGGGNSQNILSGAQAQQEKQVFALLMQELRTGLDKLKQNTGREYQLTAAVSGSEAKTQAIDWQKTIPFMDYVFTMTYDFAVGDGRAGHHTNLFSPDDKTHSTAGMINNLLNAGIPESKLVVGVAFYGRGWLQSGWQKSHFNGVNRASSIGSFTYKQLLEMPLDGYQYGYDENAQAAYLYHPEKDAFISFDDKRSIAAKANWVKSKGLAGLFSWQIRQDNGDLVSAMYENLKLK